MSKNQIFLETPRLFIKAPSLQDFDAIYELSTNPEVMRYIEVCRPVAKVREFLEKAMQHFEKHGFSFGTVIEKSSNQIIGQAGIMYLAYDDTQPNVEIGYRLPPDYWNKGYATELATVLIKWGFENTSVDKLVAVIHPENEKSRHVLEKVGMRYVGRKQAYNTEVPEYQILKNNIDRNDIKLAPATMDKLSVMQNLGRFYAYDISEYFGHEPGWEMEDNGLYDCSIDFKAYFDNSNAYPYFIYYRDELAGFAIINKIGSDKTIDFNMAQFFILRKFKNKGIGRSAAFQCFDKFKGLWEVMVMPGNEGAYRFWRRVVGDYTHQCCKEYSRQVPHFNNEWRNFFGFDNT